MIKRRSSRHRGHFSARSSAVRGFGQIAAGNGLGQLVTFFALPVLSRLYSPEDFGVFSVSLSAVALVAPLALLGLHAAVVQPRMDEQVAPLAVLSLSFLVLSSAIFGVVVYLWSTSFVQETPSRLFLSFVLSGLLLLTGTNLFLNQLVTRSGNYGSIGRRNGLQSISISLSQLLMAAFAGVAWFNGLVGGALLGTLVGVLLMIRFLNGYVLRVSLSECFTSIRKYWRFPLVFAPVTSVTLLSQQAPLFFVVYWFGTGDGGQVGMAERLVAVPLALVGLASSTVLIGELSQAVRTEQGDLTRIFLRASKWLGLLGLSVSLGLALLSPLVFPVFLGDGWETACHVAQMMAIVAGSRILANPIRGVFGLLNRARFITAAELFRLVLLGVVIFACVFFERPLLVSLAGIYAALAASDILLWFLGLSAVKQFDQKKKIHASS